MDVLTIDDLIKMVARARKRQADREEIVRILWHREQTSRDWRERQQVRLALRHIG